jgi:membrane-bound lytic murein transglycosylase B
LVKPWAPGADVGQVTRPRRLAVLVAGVVLLAGLPVASARAESAADAQAEAQAAADRVEALQPVVERALRAYDRALAGLASGVSQGITAEQAADQAAQLALSDRRTANNRVRALYMSGGSSALIASVLSASGPTDALRRLGYVQRLVQTGEAGAATSLDASAGLQARADALMRVAEESTTTASDVERRFDELSAALAEANAELARLSERARGLAAAEAAAARVSALNAAVAASGQARVASAHASEAVPAEYQRLYQAAARTCRGMSWSLLAAIGQVETGHGANTSSSYAGAQGPMQFMPATFASYGVDGDHDGDVDIHDPADAIFSAAHYLCANGAGRDEESTARAVWHYNHADWYVALVLKLAGQYAAREAG